MTDRLPSPDQTSPDQSGGLSRRELFIRGGGGLAGALVTGAAITGTVYKGYELIEERLGENAAGELLEDALKESHKISYFDGLLQVDWSTPMAADMFGDPSRFSDLSPAEDNILVAVRPVSVVDTLLRNVADQDSDVQSQVGRVLHKIPPGLFAFYWPGRDSALTYLDTNAHQGLVSPLTFRTDNFTGDTLPVYDVDVDGREVVDGVAYPYTTSSYVDEDKKRVTERHVIGNSVYVNNSADLDALVSEFYGGEELVVPPAVQKPASK